MSLLSKIVSIIAKTIHLVCSVLFCVFAGIFVFVAVIQPPIALLRGESVAAQATNAQVIHELFPRSSWNDLEPCGLHFNEQEEFNKALQCVNKNVWPESPITKEEFTHIPRCFIVKAHSPDVYTSPQAGFNFWPIFEPTPMGIAVGAVVGVYQPETRTVYIVENIDAAMVYRHELQHYFLHEHNPETGGGGHDQEIWHKCEPPYYTPSDAVKAKQKPQPKEDKKN